MHMCWLASLRVHKLCVKEDLTQFGAQLDGHLKEAFAQSAMAISIN